MKTTLMIDDGVMKRLRQEAARRETTISALVEAALRLFLENRSRAAAAPAPLPAFDGGGTFVDISDRDALYRAMEGR